MSEEKVNLMSCGSFIRPPVVEEKAEEVIKEYYSEEHEPTHTSRSKG